MPHAATVGEVFPDERDDTSGSGGWSGGLAYGDGRDVTWKQPNSNDLSMFTKADLVGATKQNDRYIN